MSFCLSSTVEMLAFYNEGANKNNKGEDLHPSSSEKNKEWITDFCSYLVVGTDGYRQQYWQLNKLPPPKVSF